MDQAGDGARLLPLVLHDDPAREYAYGPADGQPDTKVDTFPISGALYEQIREGRLDQRLPGIVAGLLGSNHGTTKSHHCHRHSAGA